MEFYSEFYTVERVRELAHEIIDIWADHEDWEAMRMMMDVVSRVDLEAGRDGLMCVCIYLAHVHTHVAGPCTEINLDDLPALATMQFGERLICPYVDDVMAFCRAARLGDFDASRAAFEQRVTVTRNIGEHYESAMFVIAVLRLAVRNLSNVAGVVEENEKREAARYN